MKIHYSLPKEIDNATNEEEIKEWCKSNALSDNLILASTGQSIEDALLSRTVNRRKVFLTMFAREVTVKAAKEIAANLDEVTLSGGMVDIVLALKKGYIKIIHS